MATTTTTLTVSVESTMEDADKVCVDMERAAEQLADDLFASLAITEVTHDVE